jgi:hypothetical protein
MLSYDEAWYGLNALELTRHFRLTPFFTDNYGRESGWMYWLAPYLLAFGVQPFALRLAAAFTGLLTLAAAYRVGREMADVQTGLWSMAALAVLYWHVQISERALRANFYVLMSALMAAALLWAYRRNTLWRWVIGGLSLGAMVYTYFASAAIVAYAGGLLLSVAFWDRRRRLGAAVALIVAFIIALPMAIYLAMHFDSTLGRPSGVAVPSGPALLHNARVWAEAWFIHGDIYKTFDPLSRPILNPITGAFALLGLVVMLGAWRPRFLGVVVLGWIGAACLPSLVTELAPQFIRASGMTVPIAVGIGAGAWAGTQWLHKVARTPWVSGLPVLLWCVAAYLTYRDVHQNWLATEEVFYAMEVHLNQGIEYLSAHTTPSDYVYFSPFTPAHPVLTFRRTALPAQHVAAFDSHECLVVPERRAAYFSLSVYENLLDELERWAAVNVLLTEPDRSRYAVLSAAPNAFWRQLTLQPMATFEDLIDLYLLSPISRTLVAGETLPVTLGLRPRQALTVYPSIFVHLYGDPTPYQGGPLWAQADRQVCVCPIRPRCGKRMKRSCRPSSSPSPRTSPAARTRSWLAPIRRRTARAWP